MIRVGRFDVVSVVTGTIRLDGGAMFGVVPKVLWLETGDVDQANRILLAMRTLVAVDRAAGRTVLVDSGAGSKWTIDEAARYEILDREGSIEAALGRFGLGPENVTDVVITHAHFDHAGGLTVRPGTSGGDSRPRFPNARHWIHRLHWEHALAPLDRDRASFMGRDFASLDAAGVLAMVEGDDPPPPMDGLRWHLSHGHTPYMLLPLIDDPAGPLLFTGDMMPTSAHIPPLWVMAYDLHPLVTIEEKMRVLDLCRTRGLALAFPHDMGMGGATIDSSGKRPVMGHPLGLD